MYTKQMRTLLPMACLMAAIPAFGSDTGPSSSQSPYLVPVAPGVQTVSVLTVGDIVENDGLAYRMVGIPDGLGAFDNGDGTFTVLMNHELRNNVGFIRDHGAIGAFVSKWTIRKRDLKVLKGEDLIQGIATWNTGTINWNAPALGVALHRLCSADLASASAFFNAAAGKGFNGRIFMDGEESDTVGRAFAHLMDGTSYELPRLGKMAFENVVAHPASGDKTIVAVTDDGPGGQVYVYVGAKTNVGANAIVQAGLNNGTLYGIKAPFLTEVDGTVVPAAGTPFEMVSLGDVSALSGAQLETNSDTGLVTEFFRPEDGAWDPNNPNDFYFVTTAGFTAKSRLWRLRFDDIANPAAGGTLFMVLDGAEGQKMLDNIGISGNGQIVMQEDPGSQNHIAKVWRYSIANGALEMVAQHDPQRFDPAVAAPLLTMDEESSGVIDVSAILGNGWYLLDVQGHYNIGDTELVEGGQLLLMRIPPGRK